MKKWVFLLLIFFFVSISTMAKGEVLSIVQKKIYGAHFFFNQKLPTETDFILTEFGPGNIRFLKCVDIAVDKEYKIQGVQITYTTADGIKRKAFLRNLKGWMFESPRPGAVFKIITIRVITADELNK
jgi:hypothetical protein